jgi:hypothetical protein
MLENVLNLVSGKLVNKKIESELELESLLMKQDIESYSDHTEKIINSIKNYKESVSDLQFWEGFKNEKIIIKEKNKENE